ncbi:amidase, partial [Nocardioides sp.]|uniref:amidase n=1 Tax=Nocardioides sp. TaxID=35761 RepID=UPI0025FE102E
MAWSFDHVGPMARTAEDCALLLDLMARPGRPVTSPPLTTLQGLRVGVAVEPLQRSQPEVRALVADAVATLEKAGAVTCDVALPHYDEADDVVMLGLAAEGLAYHHADARTRWTDYGPVARAALLTGLLVTGADLVQLQRVRRHIQRRSAALYRDVDVIIAPTCGGPAPLADGLEFNEVVGLLHTQYWNATGEPALSVPIGTVDGLPVGLQIAGPALADDLVLAVGHLYQQLTDHHLAHPLAQGA